MLDGELQAQQNTARESELEEHITGLGRSPGHSLRGHRGGQSRVQAMSK